MVRCSTWDLPAALSHLLQPLFPNRREICFDCICYVMWHVYVQVQGRCRRTQFLLKWLFWNWKTFRFVYIKFSISGEIFYRRGDNRLGKSPNSMPIPFCVSFYVQHPSALIRPACFRSTACLNLSESCDNRSRVCNASSTTEVFCWCTLNACANHDCLCRSICSLPSGCGVRNTSTTSSCPLPSTAPGPRGTRTSTTGRGKQLAFELPQDSFKMSSNDSCLFRLSFSIHQQTQIFLHFQHFRFFLGICVQFFLICCRKRKKVVAERRCKTLWVSSWCIFWFGEVQIRHCREGTTRWPRGQNYMQSSLSCFLNLTEWCWLSLVCV